MCIIAICEKRKLTDKEIENCFKRNPDGAGIGWVKGEENFYKKGLMTVHKFKKEYAKINTLPHVVHFRIGTSGSKSEYMTHPYIVSDESPLALNFSGKGGILFHNGIYSQWKSLRNVLESVGITIDGDTNDTRVIACWISKFGKKLLGKICGKFVFFQRGEIEYYGNFEEANGIKFSNDSYKTPLYTAPSISFSPSYNFNQYKQDMEAARNNPCPADESDEQRESLIDVYARRAREKKEREEAEDFDRWWERQGVE